MTQRLYLLHMYQVISSSCVWSELVCRASECSIKTQRSHFPGQLLKDFGLSHSHSCWFFLLACTKLPGSELLYGDAHATRIWVHLWPMVSEDWRPTHCSKQDLARNWVSWKQILPNIRSWADTLNANIGQSLSPRTQLNYAWISYPKELWDDVNDHHKPLGLTGCTLIINFS